MLDGLRHYCLIIVILLFGYWIWMAKMKKQGDYCPPSYKVPVARPLAW